MDTCKEAPLRELMADAIMLAETKLVLNVPGWGGTEVIEQLSKNHANIQSHICFNEEAAFGIASGASLYGERSCLLIKAHGLLKSGNALTSTMSIGANGAFVIFVFDDVYGKSSDNILNTLPILHSLETPIFFLAENPFEQIHNAFTKSEQMKLPVIIYVNCEELNKNFSYKLLTLPKSKNQIKQMGFQNVAAPVVTTYQRSILLAKLKGMDFSAIPKPTISNVGAILPEKLKLTYERYVPFFEVFKKLDKDFVSGDAGTSSLFAFPPYECVQYTSFMGDSPSMAAGAILAGSSKAWSLTGDFSFLAAGILGFNECVSLNIPLKLVIFKNDFASATGGQVVSAALMQKFMVANTEDIEEIPISASPLQIARSLNRVAKSVKREILIIHC